MKVLFVSSGNSGSMSPVVKAQLESLKRKGIFIDYYLIEGKGVKGYLKNIYRIREYLKTHTFDLIHAHYSLTAIVVTLSGFKPIVVSLMGSDLYLGKFLRAFTKYLSKYYWTETIVKSYRMLRILNHENVKIIPNGTDIVSFNSIDQSFSRKKLGWEKEKKHILFAADPNREEKNFKLFSDSMKIISESEEIETHILKGISHQEVPLYLNASDVVCISSKREGSPNVIKEAMACNRPIVSTDVGDVRWVFGETDGCYISSKHEPNEYAKLLYKAILFAKTKKATNGRQRIIELSLDSDQIAHRIISVYKELIN